MTTDSNSSSYPVLYCRKQYRRHSRTNRHFLSINVNAKVQLSCNEV